MPNRDIYSTVAKLYSEPDLRTRSDLPWAALSAGDENAWPALCCTEYDNRNLHPNFLGLVGVIRPESLVSGDCVPNMFPRLNEKLTEGFPTKFLTPLNGDLLPSLKVDKVRRLGLALHYCLLRDATDDARWDRAGKNALEKWNAQTANDSTFVPEPIGFVEAWWLWTRIFGYKLIQAVESVSTKAVFVKENGDGVVGTLNLSLIETVGAPEVGNGSGFVPSPTSFAYYLDSDFRDSFKNTSHYLNGLGIWLDHPPIEWDIRLPSNTRRMVLEGGSAGAAIALAAGSLLAKRAMKSMKEGK